jgi:hypothetical protein
VALVKQPGAHGIAIDWRHQWGGSVISSISEFFVLLVSEAIKHSSGLHFLFQTLLINIGNSLIIF